MNFNAPLQFEFVEPPTYKASVDSEVMPVTLKNLCLVAGIQYRFICEIENNWFIDETTNQHFKTKQGNIIGISKFIQEPEPIKAMRIIEIMAYSFFDYAARECVCGKGYFGAPER